MAPSIKADSRPSLKIIENDEENAIAGATVPIPETNLSDSSNPLLSSAILETTSSDGAFEEMRLRNSANFISISRVKSGSIGLNGTSIFS